MAEIGRDQVAEPKQQIGPAMYVADRVDAFAFRQSRPARVTHFWSAAVLSKQACQQTQLVALPSAF